MKITIKSIHIENFKGIKMLDVTFSGKTKISGQNAVGKTTIFDAFTWLLFNKNSSGEEKFNVRPLNEGIRVDNVEIKVSAILNFPRHRNRTGLRSVEPIRQYCRGMLIRLRLTAIRRVKRISRHMFRNWHRARKCSKC